MKFPFPPEGVAAFADILPNTGSLPVFKKWSLFWILG